MSTSEVFAYLQGGEGRTDRLVLRGAGPLLVGRSKSCDLVIADSRVSKQHARLWFSSSRWYINPEPDTTNPLLVNGAPVRAPTALSTGDVLGFGRKVAYTFINDSEDAAGTAEAPTEVDDVSSVTATAAAGARQERLQADATKPARLRILDICEALVQATPPGWPDTPKAWVIATCDRTVVQPRDVHRLWDARNRAAHASRQEVKHHRMLEAAETAEKIVAHLTERGVQLEVYQTAVPVDNEEEAQPT